MGGKDDYKINSSEPDDYADNSNSLFFFFTLSRVSVLLKSGTRSEGEDPHRVYAHRTWWIPRARNVR